MRRICWGLILVMALMGLVVPVGAVNHPNLLLTAPNLAVLKEKVVSGKTQEVFNLIGERYPANYAEAVEQAFRYRVNKARGVSYGKSAENAKGWLWAYVSNPLNDPVELWKYPVKYKQGWDVMPVALLYDWLYDYLTDQERGVVRNYLLKWVPIFEKHSSAYMGWLYNNQFTSPVAAYAVILMTTAGEDGYPPDGNSRLMSILNNFKKQFFSSAIKYGGNLGEGLHYQNLSLPVVTVMAACAQELGLLDLTGTNAERIMDWFKDTMVSDNKLISYADHGTTDPSKLWLEYSFYLGKFKNNDQYWAWNYYKRNSLDVTPWPGIAGKPMFVLYYDNGMLGVKHVNTSVSKFIADENKALTGGVVVLRDKFGGDGVVMSLINRDLYHEHSNYDPNSIELYFRGKRFFADRQTRMGYDNMDHGFDKEHNLVVIDGGGNPKNDKPYSDDSATNGKIPLFIELGSDALVLGDARYPVVDLSQFWNPNGLVDDISRVIPAIRADRRIVLAGDYLTSPVIIVTDDYEIDDKEHNYSLLYHVDKEVVVAGSGGVGDPMTLARDGEKVSVYLVRGGKFGPVENFEEILGDKRDYHLLVKADSYGKSAKFVTIITTGEHAWSLKEEMVDGVRAYRIRDGLTGRSLLYVDNENGDLIFSGGVKSDAKSLLLGLNGDRMERIWALDVRLLNYLNNTFPEAEQRKAVVAKVSDSNLEAKWTKDSRTFEWYKVGLISSIPPSKTMGDANGDGLVNLSDLAIWKSEYFGGGGAADFNDDGGVNLTDLGIWKTEYLL